MTFDAGTLSVPLSDAADDSAWRAGWLLSKPLSVSEWADTHRVLTSEGAAEPGPWETSRTPHLQEIMDCLSDEHPSKKVVLVKSTQIGGTEVLNNFAGYIIHHSPGPTMVVMPTEKLAQRWSNQRLKTMLNASPALRAIIAPNRSRDASNTTLMKEFPGGFLVIAGANSASDLRSMPARRVLADEVDEYPEDLEDQGSPLELAERRASTFVRRKIFVCSSPKLLATSVVWREFLAGDQRSRHLPCPYCHTLQELNFDQLLPDGTYLCNAGDCGKIIEEHHKTWMLDPANGAVWIPAAPTHDYPSFKIHALYAPLGLGYTWNEIAELRDAAQKNPSKQVTFTNTIMGLPFEGERQQQDAGEIEQRAERGVFRGVVPKGRYLLTMGVDCQYDRFAVSVVAWGRGEKASVIEYLEIPGDPSQPDGYDQLKAYLPTTFANHRGIAMLPQVVAIDGGNWTEEVAKFVRSMGSMQGSFARRMVKVGANHTVQHIAAVRGRSHKSERVVYRPGKTEINDREKTIARSVGIWGVGTEVAKHILFSRMAADGGVEDPESRMLRFPGGREAKGPEDHEAEATYLPRSYYDGLTVEFYDLGAKRWVTPKGARNEPLDTLVYAYWAALSPAMRMDLIREPQWKELESRYEPPVDLFTPSPDAVVASVPATASAGRAPQKSKFVSGEWKFE